LVQERFEFTVLAKEEMRLVAGFEEIGRPFIPFDREQVTTFWDPFYEPQSGVMTTRKANLTHLSLPRASTHDCRPVVSHPT
jgi:hypothetical protein